MNKCKNEHYKSAVQWVNSDTQTITADTILSNPRTLALGNKITDTGCAIDFNAYGLTIETSGLYRITADFDIEGTTGGDVAFALTANGVVLPETLHVVTVVAAVEKNVHIDTVRRFHVCNAFDNYTIGIIAYSDGTAVADIDRITGNIVKLA